MKFRIKKVEGLFDTVYFIQKKYKYSPFWQYISYRDPCLGSLHKQFFTLEQAVYECSKLENLSGIKFLNSKNKITYYDCSGEKIDE